YISATKELFEAKGTPEKWETYWKDKKTKLVHFIGKDNIIFHAIVFPAMIMAHGDYVLPENVPANEFLNLDGGKLSKSKGHGILVKDVVKTFNPDIIRYAIAANMPENKDADFSWEDLQNKNNNELAAILGNFINRTVVFAKNKFGNKIPERISKERPEVFKYITEQKKVIEDSINNYRFRDALNEIMNIARAANKYFNDSEPWKVIKDDASKCGEIINDCLEICHTLAIAIYPVLPFTSERILAVLNKDNSDISWDKIGKVCLKPGNELGENVILFPQLELAAAKEEEPKEEDNLITIDDFKKVQLRTAVVIKAEKVEKSKKLLKLRVKCGDKEKQIVAGIAEFYAPEDMENRKIVIVNNLKPAKLMGLESQGMLLAAKIDGKLKLIGIDGDLPDGADVS
ncbi:MAG: methionine--tRNA ligase subunit beta, partial [Bacteroidetes bacterium]|nr:methionine--tRNA ligase subunit beta [Bacteroidota bacterium]